MGLILENAAVIGDEFAFRFSDGVEGFIPLPMLRRACPCAACQGEPDAMGRVLRPRVDYGPGAFDLVRFETIGGYALQLFWKDGHSSGIYSYWFLRRLIDLPSGGSQ